METTDVYEHSLSAETIANNVDILTTILLRVPAKYLVRFKCISKHWLSLISDSKFCNDHTRKNLNPTVSGLYVHSCPLINFNTKTQNGQQSLPKLDFINESLHEKVTITRKTLNPTASSLYVNSRPLINFNTKIQNGQQSLPKLDFINESLHGQVTIEQSCNGLLLCFCGAKVIVCNPTVQKFKVVPDYKIQSWSFFLSFSPSKSPYFKVVMILSKLLIAIYSSESGMWETSDVCQLDLKPLSRFVFCDGAIYWMAEGNNLMRFDIDAKTMTTHQTSLDPKIFSSGVFSYRILYFRGHGRYLTLVQSTSWPSQALQILEMDTRNFRWTIKYDLDLGLCVDPPSVKKWFGLVYIIYLKRGDEEETPALLIAKAKSREFVMYNLKSKRWEKILEDLPHDIESKLGRFPLTAHEFIESLALF